MSGAIATRYRSVSATSTRGPLDSDLESLVDLLHDVDDHSFSALAHALAETGCLQRLRHTLIDGDNVKEAKDAFRRVHGFQTLLGFFAALAAHFDAARLSEEEKRTFFSLFKDGLSVLVESLRDHFGNGKYFAARVEEGGWSALERALSGLNERLSSVKSTARDTEQFFGSLLAAATGQEMLSELYTSLRSRLKKEDAGNTESGAQKEDPPDVVEQKALTVQRVQEQLAKLMNQHETVRNPDIVPMFLHFWFSQRRTQDGQSLGLAVPSTFLLLGKSSRQNMIALHTTGILSIILPQLFDGKLPEAETRLWRQLVLALCEEGINDLEDAHYLFRKASTSVEVARFLVDALRSSKTPSSIHFDLSFHGYSSVELPTLGKSFPPMKSDGYTLAIWARFDSFDSAAHTTMFGAFDTSQTCFVLAYLEKDTRNFILQTSIQGNRPSVRFKSVTFEAGQWYHICVVHRRPRTMSSSRASLFINGDFIEQLKANYPTPPPARGPNKEPRIQAFLGTPQDLGKGASISKWSLASCVLFEEAFSDDLISVFYNLGPRYHGNFQDCLGSFQTYQASAALNLRNEYLHPGKEEHSDIVSAIRKKASTLVAESSILLNISPAAVLDSDDRNNIDESQLVKSLSKQAAKNLQQFTRSGGNAVAINGAVPAINDALTQTHGVAILAGTPVVAVPQSLDDASWRIGGCAAVGLSLVQAASTAESVGLAVDILLETVKDNWRNSEAMEKESGYGVLATLLRDKLGFQGAAGSKTTSVVGANLAERNELALQLLCKVLAFVGYDLERPERSIINNPLAYRVLLVDSDVWRFADLSVQKLYYEQFVTFGVASQHHRFNAKRLSRMRVLKKLLDALKGETLSTDALPVFMTAFKSLLSSNPSAEILRSLALFITYSVHRSKMINGLRPKKSTRLETRPRRTTLTRPGANENTPSLSRLQLGTEFLKLYADLLCSKEDTAMIKKFARTVTNKWLLYLMSEAEAEVVILATKILARLLVVHGSSYIKKFTEKSGGFVIMRHRLKRWWSLPTLWPLCFAVLFNSDVAGMDLDKSFDLFGFLELFAAGGDAKVVYPEIFLVVTGMLQSGLNAVVHEPRNADHGSHSPISGKSANSGLSTPVSQHRRSMSSITPLDLSGPKAAEQNVETLNIIIRFLADIHTRSQSFRDFTVSTNYAQDLLYVLYPVVVGSDALSADLELHARGSGISFEGKDVLLRPLSNAPPILRTINVDPPVSPHRSQNLRRGSSFVLVTSDTAKHIPSSARLQHPVSPRADGNVVQLNNGHAIVQSLLELIIAVFSDQLLSRKDFPGLGLFLKTPPGFIEHQTYFESWVLRNTLSQISNTIMLNQKLLWEPKVLTNLARFFTHVGEAVYEGWFIGGASATLDFAGAVLEYLQRPDIAQIKTVRLCNQAVSIIRAVVFRTVLLNLAELNDAESLSFLERLTYWQTVLLSSEETHSDYLPLMCYLLYAPLMSSQESVRSATANLWRIILVQKPDEASSILNHATSSQHRRLASSFQKLIELDNPTFLVWVDDHREELDSFFFGTLSKSWDAFVSEENTKTEESAKSRLSKRRDRLKQWHQEELAKEDVIRRHEVTFDHWTSNIYTSESVKHQRALQDQQDSFVYMETNFARMRRELTRPFGLFAAGTDIKWRLDQTEGRNRMRLRIIPDSEKEQQEYLPKRKASENMSLKLDTRIQLVTSKESIGATPSALVPENEPFPDLPAQSEDNKAENNTVDAEDRADLDESFELIEDPTDDQEDTEDKNRKVLRSLHRGDQVKHVANISRIVGLEAVEGLLILGKDSLYLLDNFFQRADGEIVNVWQAPHEERDSYVRMIAGREATERKTTSGNNEHETRSWKWEDIISVSKRRFLLRDVGLEIFFSDGRSYLLTVMSPALRDDLHGHIISRSPQLGTSSTSARSEDMWRFETLKSPDDQPQSFGSKFANVFSQGSANPATRKWVKGEISNFHYLMLINTMAGRTFNDLTQYPVFPWVLADYTSEELDLTNPRSFRDLTRPMGCQTKEREEDYRMRYQSFAEMGDHNAPPYHYGTHYSSAMTVTSYLIRMEPFVKSYLLLQGGAFDHADRLFYSIEKAWKSASRINMTDVRELIPEFYYLPEFLTNSNKYDFGLRQGSQPIDNVELPPWAKGDPKIFVAKHREALESPYVTQHLHHWIDLVFGYKQKGEAAIDAVNVFHHLSYQGAKDLDLIEDPMERLATIGIIHNFGQTPYQVFQRPHAQREEARHKFKRIDTAAESLTRLPFSLLDSHERVASLLFSWKQEKMLCSAAFRLNIPPHYEKYMEWGFADGSARFYSAETRKLIGHFEHLHVGQLSCGIFPDSRTLITSGTDCTISVWSFISSTKSVDLQPKATLFGHRSPVTVLAVSRSFSAILSASSDGEVLLWDLNRLEFVRALDVPSPIECAKINDVTGDIMLCYRNRIRLFTLNGALLTDQKIGDKPDDSIVSCAFYEGAGHEWLERDILFTGHRRGVVKVWSKTINDDKFELELIRQLNHVDSAREDGSNVLAGISCILPMPQVVYTGDEDGRVYEWDCVQRH